MKALRRLFSRVGRRLPNETPADPPAPSYDADHLRVWNKTVSFLQSARFKAAYRSGMYSGHKFHLYPGHSDDIHIEWRVHTMLWAASHAVRLPGDFVECGVNTGIYSLAVCNYLDFNRTDKSFYLFDTFSGIPVDQITAREAALGRLTENSTYYEECYEVARKNFAPYPRAILVRGRVPETLRNVDVAKVCYLSIDMNIVAPEIAALEFFWDKLSPGAPVILDDYGWSGYVPQREAMDEFAARHGVEILDLPTGQGLLLKPPG